MRIMKMYKGLDIVRANLENYYYVTVNPTPSDALVEFSCRGAIRDGNTIIVPYGTIVNYKVSKDYYKIIEETIVIDKSIDINVDLEKYKTNRFSYKQDENYEPIFQEYIVPTNIHLLDIDCFGGKGIGINGASSYPGRVQCKLKVIPNQTLYIMIGKTGKETYIASYNASDIRTNNNGILDEESLKSRLVVAGGGANYCISDYKDGRDITSSFSGGNIVRNDDEICKLPQNGTQTAGGEAGKLLKTSQNSYTLSEYVVSKPGQFGLGSEGYIENSSNDDYITSVQIGAGGAGYYGGASGMLIKKISSNATICKLYGSGGGSSYANSELCTDISYTTAKKGWYNEIYITPIK